MRLAGVLVRLACFPFAPRARPSRRHGLGEPSPPRISGYWAAVARASSQTFGEDEATVPATTNTIIEIRPAKGRVTLGNDTDVNAPAHAATMMDGYYSSFFFLLSRIHRTRR